MSETLFVAVALDQNVGKSLDYSVPAQWANQMAVGVRVEVPLKDKIVKGTITQIKQQADCPAPRPIVKLLSAQSELSEPLWKLARWMAKYYASSLQKVLRCFIPPNIRKEVQAKTQRFLTLLLSKAEALRACEELRIKKPLHALILETFLQAKKGIFFSELLKETNISRSAVDTLIKKKWIGSENITSEESLLLDQDFFLSQPKQLTFEQAKCLDSIAAAIDANTFSAHLIQGVTGSGKTEIYLQAIDLVLKKGKSAIFLVPEISLTSQTIERFRARFPDKLALLHHRRSLGERASSWESLRSGDCKIAIGARSAVFCPIQNLGLIIVDEEHDSSYKQSDEAPCYQGRDVAVMRAYLEQAIVILGSATPSIESRYNAEIGKYSLHILRARATSATLPQVRVIDMKKEMQTAGGFTHFSQQLLDAIKERMAAGEQTLLFLNRRGYHRMQLCSQCHTIARCPHCDISLTYHRSLSLLKCHMCSFTQPPLRSCPSCKASNTIEFKGFGTEHVERSLHAIFPEVRTLRMDKDTTQKKNSHEELFKQFRAHKADVLIGTQMIAKGFHFPSVTLVGVLNIDASLTIPDFRSPENVFQLLTQVAGRAGRSSLPGTVLFQTFLPEHPVIRFAADQDYEAFYQATLEERRLFAYPPFTHLIKLVFTANTEEKAREAAQRAHEILSKRLPPPVTILPVGPAGHPKIQNRFRYQFLVKTTRLSLIEKQIGAIAAKDVKIDVDTNSTFF